MMKRFVHAAVAAAMFLPIAPAFAGPKTSGPPTTQSRPNVLIFLLDDVGYGQLGSFGGPIRTPNIDRVAKMGLRYANHHTTALCSPSRAALLTGRNHHSVGFGVIAEIATSEPGYTGVFPADKQPLVQSLRQQGYATAAFGKWHNTPMDQLGADAPHTQRPTDLGFERFYGFNAGDTSQYEPLLYDDNRLVQPNVGNPDYHLTTDMTDKTISWLEDWQKKGEQKPFFAFYATGAAHAPHHAPPGYINRYVGAFDQGWDKVREETFARQKAMGLFPEVAELTPRTAEISAWDDLTKDEKRLYARMQEIFAGFVEHTDAEFGRVLDKIEAMGQLDNTIIIVTSDNGASGEGGLSGTFNESLFFNALPESLEENLARIDELGTKLSYNHYPAGWALAGNTPFQYFKQTTNEGGVADPFIIAWKGKIRDEGAVRHQYTHINDVMPTVLDIAKVPMLAEVNGVRQQPLEGVSFARSIFDASVPTEKKIQYYEMLGNRALWMDGWKAVAFHGRLPWDSSFQGMPFDNDKWQLYDMINDPTEANDLSDVYPERLAAMKSRWNEEAEKYHVFPLDDSTATRMLATRRMYLGDSTEFTYTEKDSGLSQSTSAPTIANSHTIRAKVLTGEHPCDGVIVGAGGRFGGFSVFVKNNHLHYAYNYVGRDRQLISAPDPLPSGPLDIEVRVVKEGEGSVVTLSVNSTDVVTGSVKKLVPIVYGITDTFDIGSDLGSPVSTEYESPFAYEGKILNVTVKITQ